MRRLEPKCLLSATSATPSKRVISFEEGQELSESLGLKFVEASARIAHNVEAAFETLVSELVSSHELRGSAEGSALIGVDRPPRAASVCAC